MNKPFAASCADNQQVILACLKKLFIEHECLLEIGSGTGQHAVYFAGQMPNLIWQASDLAEQISGMQLWFDEAKRKNILAPMVLNVSQKNWLNKKVAYVFTANTTHIISWNNVQCLFAGVSEVLKPGGLFAQYGPFNYNGQFTSESNARFDQWLKSRDPDSGIRDFEDLLLLAQSQGLILHSDHQMPANNRILVWQKT